jgi:hypothetical protein
LHSISTTTNPIQPLPDFGVLFAVRGLVEVVPAVVLTGFFPTVLDRACHGFVLLPVFFAAVVAVLAFWLATSFFDANILDS